MLSSARKHLLDLALIIGLGVLFPLIHNANAWLFSFAVYTPNIGLIYLPAFIRLLSVLLLGKFKGTVAGLLGGLLLLVINGQELTVLSSVHILCSAAGPLIGVLLFEHWRGRPVQLVSLADLGLVTLIYCLANATVHHLAWAWLAPDYLKTPAQVLWMVLGDLVGTLIGAYLLKWTAQRLIPGGRST